jgi:hypothetical protein
MTTATSRRNSFVAYATCVAVLGALMGVVLFGGSAVTPMQTAISAPNIAAIEAEY